MMFLENRVIEQNKKELSCSLSNTGILCVSSLGSMLGERGKCENVLCLSSVLAFKDSDTKPYKMSSLLPYPQLEMHTSALELVTN